MHMGRQQRRRVLRVSMALGIAAALAGCGAEQQATTSTVTVTNVSTAAAQTIERTVPTTVVTTETKVTTKAVTITESTTPTTPATSGAAAGAKATFTARTGYIAKAVGEEARLTRDDETVLAFTITKIDANLKCTGPLDSKPENGRLVGIYIKVQVYPTFDPSTDSAPFFSGDSFRVFGPDGSSESENWTTAAAGCVKSSERIEPNQDVPGTKAEGWAVIDTKFEHGSLLLDVPGSSGGWEWRY